MHALLEALVAWFAKHSPKAGAFALILLLGGTVAWIGKDAMEEPVRINARITAVSQRDSERADWLSRRMDRADSARGALQQSLQRLVGQQARIIMQLDTAGHRMTRISCQLSASTLAESRKCQ